MCNGSQKHTFKKQPANICEIFEKFDKDLNCAETHPFMAQADY